MRFIDALGSDLTDGEVFIAKKLLAPVLDLLPDFDDATAVAGRGAV
jgi:hypothetical protein